MKVKNCWFWYYRNWEIFFRIFFWITMLSAAGFLLSVPEKEYSIGVGIIILGTALVFVFAVGHVMSWLAERYLRTYDDGYRWIRGLPPRGHKSPFRISNTELLSTFKDWFIQKLKLK